MNVSHTNMHVILTSLTLSVPESLLLPVNFNCIHYTFRSDMEMVTVVTGFLPSLLRHMERLGAH